MGMVWNFEFARRKAGGKYFLWHGDDDYLDPHYVSACVDLLESDSKLILAYGLAAYHAGDGKILEYGRKIDPRSKFAFLRVVAYLWQVTDNSIFCGLYRKEAVENCIHPRFLCGDYCWIAEVLSVGTVKRIPGILVYRECGESASTSPEGVKKLVKTLDLPDWQGRFPTFAIAANIASFVLDNPKCFAKRAGFQSLPLAITVFFLLLAKRWFERFKLLVKQIPGVRSLHRQYLRYSSAAKRA
jgi:hypothetical protein